MQRKYMRRSIQNSDPGKIMDLIVSLTEDTCAQLQVKINRYLIEECEAETVFQIIVHNERAEAFIEAIGTAYMPGKIKIEMSDKFTDALKSNVEHTELLQNLDVGFQNIVMTHMPKDNANTKKRVVLCPVQGSPFSVLFCAVASKIQEGHVAIIIHECSLFTWPILKKAIQLEYECTLKQKCQQLLRVTRKLFTQVASLDTLLHIATDQAKLLTKAEYCFVMLVDVDKMELYSLPFTGHDEELRERRFPMTMGIAGEVIKTGTLINTRSPRTHPAFNAAIDSVSGVDCRNLLCFPIREQSGIVGVGQLMNKIGDPYFDGMDEEMALAFSIYCGVCIIHSVVYQKIQEAHIRNALANELVMYHMKVTDAEVQRMLECPGFHQHPHLNTLNFNHRVLPLRELPCYVFRMFVNLEFDKKFNINHTKICRFIMIVKKGYRDVPYHNWCHSFNVAQWAYAALCNFQLVCNGYMTELQALMYMLAALMHDLDHRGTTSSFQINGHTTLAALYSSEGSVMERHHLAQAMCILNTEGCDILETLHRKDYDRAIMLLRDYILATDLSNYTKNQIEYKTIAMDFQKTNKAHQMALHCLLTNAADLSDQLKDWQCIKSTAAAVLTEFFKQGEIEKSHGEMPINMMDREKCFIPTLQIQFLRDICIPLYEIVGKIFPKAAACADVITSHIEKWEAAMPVFAEVPLTAGLSVLLSPELDNLIELNLLEKEQEKERMLLEEKESCSQPQS